MTHKLQSLEEDFQNALSRAWLALTALLSVTFHRVPKGAYEKVIGGLTLALITDTIVGLPAIVEAAAALLPIEVELSYGAPLILSVMASAVLIATGFAADLSRAYATGATRIMLTFAALVPIAVVVTLASIYTAQLLTLTAEDAMRTDALVKLLVPAFAAIAAHLIVFCNSPYFFSAREQRVDNKRRAQLMDEWKKLRAVAQEYVACAHEYQQSLRQLAPFGNLGVNVSQLPRQAKLYLAVANKILEPGDPSVILLELRKSLHAPSGGEEPTTDDGDTPPPGPVSPTANSIDTDEEVVSQARRRNGNAPSLVMMGALASILVAPSIADANRLAGRTSGRGYQATAGRPAQSIQAMRPRGELNRPPTPRLQQSPTPQQIAQQRKQLPTGRAWVYTANLEQTRARSRSGHRAAGNRQLARAMAQHEGLRRRVENKFGRDTHERLRRGRNPRGAEWDHSTFQKGFLQLMTRGDHAKLTRRQGRAGGGAKKYWPETQRRPQRSRPRPGARR